MCGIIGIIGNHNPDQLFKLRERINHRGPDDKGTFYAKDISLGQTRLSILDPSPNAHQPMLSQDGNYVIIFNGEIYNHLEIRKSLTSKYNFISSGDTETLLYGFIEYGKDILNKLNGIFSFAVYNKSTGNIFIARDQFGVKPLYYFQKENIFLFGSEIKSFLEHTGFDRSVCPEAFVNYLNFGWSPGELTSFKYVKKLLPGHFIELNIQSPQEFKISKYYNLPFDGKYSSKTEVELINELEEKLLAAVKRQMLSDVPVAFFLSGGLDSTSLVAIARKLYPDKKIQCFTIETKGMQKSEGFSEDLKYARQAAAYLNVDLEVVEADQQISRDFDKIIYHLDEPQADSAPFHILSISEKAKQMGYKVLISGTGGDDIFSGYRRHQALQLEKYFKWMPAFALKFIKILTNQLKIKSPQIRRLKKIFANAAVHKETRMASYYSLLPFERTLNLFSEKIKKEISLFNPLSYLIKLLSDIPHEHSDLNKMLYWEMKIYLPDHNLNYTDKLSMAAGVEVRVPFLDRELVEFSTKIPPSLKMKGTTTKYLFRKVMERYLPAEIINRPKTGFGIPPSRLIEKELETKINEYLSTDQIRKREIFNADKVWELINENKKGSIDASYTIWGLLAIESWHRQFVDQKMRGTNNEVRMADGFNNR